MTASNHCVLISCRKDVQFCEATLPSRIRERKGGFVALGKAFFAYWIAVPPEGEVLSLPPELIELELCQIVPVVLVKK